jgi:hypothetical protein
VDAAFLVQLGKVSLFIVCLHSYSDASGKCHLCMESVPIGLPVVVTNGSADRVLFLVCTLKFGS